MRGDLLDGLLLGRDRDAAHEGVEPLPGGGEFGGVLAQVADESGADVFLAAFLAPQLTGQVRGGLGGVLDAALAPAGRLAVLGPVRFVGA